jgi:site-specific DNA recombinase
MVRVGIYLRISDDRDGNQTATQRQEEDCRKYAEAKGWEVTDVFEDVDLSAYKRNVKRPEFERMILAVRHREIDGVLAWKIDRITRRQRDLVRLDEECVERKAFIATVVDQIDTRTPTGRFVAELLVAQARMESENASIRIKRSADERAKQGQVSLGGTRPFGYTRQREIIPEEAEIIQEAARRVLAGEGVRGVAYDWERRGVKTPHGRPWRQEWVRTLLVAAVLSGQRELDGVLIPGTWPAILTPDTTARLRIVLEKKKRTPSGREPRKLLLGGGFARCGRCGGALVGRPRPDGARRYVCARQPGTPNCGRLARLAEPVEELVTRAVFIALDGVDLAAYMKRTESIGDDGLLTSVRDDEEALEQLSRDHYVDKVIGRSEFFVAREGIQARLEANRMKLARKQGQEVLHTVVGAGREVEKRWESASLEWKRAVLSSVLDHVEIMPVGKGRHQFNHEAIKLIWKF